MSNAIEFFATRRDRDTLVIEFPTSTTLPTLLRLQRTCSSNQLRGVLTHFRAFVDGGFDFTLRRILKIQFRSLHDRLRCRESSEDLATTEEGQEI